jgi:hypothetical protein
MAMTSPLINTPFQRGAKTSNRHGNRFNGFSRVVKTVETVFEGGLAADTPLKQGANENGHGPACFNSRMNLDILA